jgi:hypothetical protein
MTPATSRPQHGPQDPGQGCHHTSAAAERQRGPAGFTVGVAPAHTVSAPASLTSTQFCVLTTRLSTTCCRSAILELECDVWGLFNYSVE